MDQSHASSAAASRAASRASRTDQLIIWDLDALVIEVARQFEINPEQPEDSPLNTLLGDAQSQQCLVNDNGIAPPHFNLDDYALKLLTCQSTLQVWRNKTIFPGQPKHVLTSPAIILDTRADTLLRALTTVLEKDCPYAFKPEFWNAPQEKLNNKSPRQWISDKYNEDCENNGIISKIRNHATPENLNGLLKFYGIPTENYTAFSQQIQQDLNSGKKPEDIRRMLTRSRLDTHPQCYFFEMYQLLYRLPKTTLVSTKPNEINAAITAGYTTVDASHLAQDLLDQQSMNPSTTLAVDVMLQTLTPFELLNKLWANSGSFEDNEAQIKLIIENPSITAALWSEVSAATHLNRTVRAWGNELKSYHGNDLHSATRIQETLQKMMALISNDRNGILKRLPNSVLEQIKMAVTNQEGAINRHNAARLLLLIIASGLSKTLAPTTDNRLLPNIIAALNENLLMQRGQHSHMLCRLDREIEALSQTLNQEFIALNSGSRADVTQLDNTMNQSSYLDRTGDSWMTGGGGGASIDSPPSSPEPRPGAIKPAAASTPGNASASSTPSRRRVTTQRMQTLLNDLRPTGHPYQETYSLTSFNEANIKNLISDRIFVEQYINSAKEKTTLDLQTAYSIEPLIKKVADNQYEVLAILLRFDRTSTYMAFRCNEQGNLVELSPWNSTPLMTIGKSDNDQAVVTYHVNHDQVYLGKSREQTQSAEFNVTFNTQGLPKVTPVKLLAELNRVNFQTPQERFIKTELGLTLQNSGIIPQFEAAQQQYKQAEPERRVRITEQQRHLGDLREHTPLLDRNQPATPAVTLLQRNAKLVDDYYNGKNNTIGNLRINPTNTGMQFTTALSSQWHWWRNKIMLGASTIAIIGIPLLMFISNIASFNQGAKFLYGDTAEPYRRAIILCMVGAAYAMLSAVINFIIPLMINLYNQRNLVQLGNVAADAVATGLLDHPANAYFAQATSIKALMETQREKAPELEDHAFALDTLGKISESAKDHPRLSKALNMSNQATESFSQHVTSQIGSQHRVDQTVYQKVKWSMWVTALLSIAAVSSFVAFLAIQLSNINRSDAASTLDPGTLNSERLMTTLSAGFGAFVVGSFFYEGHQAHKTRAMHKAQTELETIVIRRSRPGNAGSVNGS